MAPVALNEKKYLSRFFEVVAPENIEVILGDREFIGADWMQFLHELGICYIFRIKNNMYVIKGESRIQVNALMALAERGKSREVEVMLGNIPVKLAGTRSSGDELVIVVASQKITENPLTNYRLRWLIELFFKSIKTKGFNLEETHVTASEKIEKLMALVALACLLIVKAGSLRHLLKKIPVKNHGRPLYSLFTYGLDLLRRLFCNLAPPELAIPIGNS